MTKDGRGLKRLFDLPETISSVFAKSIRTLLIEACTNSWEEYYGKIKQYLVDNSDTYPAWNSSLGNWINSQRQQFKKGLLSKVHIEKLLALPGWIWNSLDSRWLQMFELAKEYQAEHKSFPRQDGKGYDKLVNWIALQRKTYNSGRLSKDRIELLESLEGWEWNPFDDRWLSKFNLTLAYIEEHDVLPPTREKIIGPFCSKMRNEYRAGILAQDKIEKFESIPIWEWDLDRSRFMDKYRRLKSYLLENYSLPSYDEDKILVEWINTVRRAYKNKKLDEYKIDLLNDLMPLGWAWSQEEIALKKWYEEYNQYADFVDKNGRHPTKGEGRLATWKDIQRIYKSKGRLNDDQIRKLESIGFVWPGARARAGDSNYQSRGLRCYNNLTLPDATPNGKWYYGQRERYRMGTLTDERIDLLMSIAKKIGKSRHEFLG